MVNYIILGATGSIGTQALNILRFNNYNLVAFSYGKNTDKAIDIIKEFKPKYVSTNDILRIDELRSLFPDVVIFEGNVTLVKLLQPSNIECFILVV